MNSTDVPPPLEESKPFEQSILGSAVRVTTKDGIPYLCIRDFIMHLCDKTDQRALEIWDRLSKENKDELREFCSSFRFPESRQFEQLVISFPGAIKLAMLLPGKHVKRYLRKFAEIISRYLDGDLKMCSEIVENNCIGKKRSYSNFLQEVERSIQENPFSVQATPQVYYVYATQTPALPGLIKIGRTTNMKTRLSQLNTACAPSPHIVVAIAPTFNMTRDESAAHEFFAHARKEGEFFAITIEEVTNFFVQHIMARHQKELVEHMGYQ